MSTSGRSTAVHSTSIPTSAHLFANPVATSRPLQVHKILKFNLDSNSCDFFAASQFAALELGRSLNSTLLHVNVKCKRGRGPRGKRRGSQGVLEVVGEGPRRVRDVKRKNQCQLCKENWECCAPDAIWRSHQQHMLIGVGRVQSNRHVPNTTPLKFLAHVPPRVF
jgi:hypothetical protein